MIQINKYVRELSAVAILFAGMWIGWLSVFTGLVESELLEFYVLYMPAAAVLSILVGGLIGGIQLARTQGEET